MKDLEKKILEQFKKKMKMEDKDLIITLDEGEYGEFMNGAVIMEPKGKVWQVTTYSTGRIKGIYEL